MSFLKTKNPELLKKEGFVKEKEEPSGEKNATEQEATSPFIKTKGRPTHSTSGGGENTIKITGGCNNHTSIQCWIFYPSLLTLGAISLGWKIALATNCTCNYLLPGAISHLNLILSVQVFDFVFEEVIPDTVSCALSLCTCNSLWLRKQVFMQVSLKAHMATLFGGTRIGWVGQTKVPSTYIKGMKERIFRNLFFFGFKVRLSLSSSYSHVPLWLEYGVSRWKTWFGRNDKVSLKLTLRDVYKAGTELYFSQFSSLNIFYWSQHYYSDRHQSNKLTNFYWNPTMYWVYSKPRNYQAMFCLQFPVNFISWGTTIWLTCPSVHELIEKIHFHLPF